MTKRMLIAYAHPDDESFGIGSLIAKYSAEGVENTLICATDGDVGTVEPEKMKGYATIRDLRLAELNCAAEVLGFKEVITFGYRDSGMMNSADNADPRSLWQAPLEDVTTRIADVMRRVCPQVVITFDPFGAYGHPDHIKIHQATLAAFALIKAESEADPPQKLYYAAFPRALIRVGVRVLRLMGRDPRHMGSNHDMDFQAVLDAAQPIHTRVNVAAYYDAGQKAAACHDSQGGGRTVNFPGGAWIARQFMSRSAFTRVEPPPLPGQPPETDLFAGVVERSP